MFGHEIITRSLFDTNTKKSYDQKDMHDCQTDSPANDANIETAHISSFFCSFGCDFGPSIGSMPVGWSEIDL